MRILLLIFLLSLCFVSSAEEQAQAPLNLMPAPAKLQVGSGQLAIDGSFTAAIEGHKDARLSNAVQRFLDNLRRETGSTLLSMKMATGSSATLTIHADHAAKDVQELGEDESYTLEVTTTGAKLNAPTTLGILRGLQTFLQAVSNTPSGFAVPAVSIQDQPRFPWRGLLIDTGRHFMPIDLLKRNLDGMEAVKMNVLHLHISENQGFRIESKKFPKLHEMGSDGLFYTRCV